MKLTSDVKRQYRTGWGRIIWYVFLLVVVLILIWEMPNITPMLRF